MSRPGGQRTTAEEGPFRAGADDPPRGEVPVEGGHIDLIGERGRELVRQIPPDVGRVMDDIDAHLTQVGRRTDARQHQQLRRCDRTGAHYYLSAALDGGPATILQVFDADRALAFEDHTPRARV